MNKYPTLTVRTKDKTKPPTGANTEVLIDGEKAPFISSVKFEAHARKVSKITIEMYGYAEIESMGDFSTKILPLKSQRVKGTRKVKANGRKA